MRTNLSLQFGLLVVILSATTCNGFFLEFPKKIIMNILRVLKEKKEAKKMLNGIHHYHVHYYPFTHVFSETPVKAPKAYELEDIHNEHLASLGWSKHEYKYVPEPKNKIPLDLTDSWSDAPNLPEIEDGDILVQVPYGEKIIIEHPKGKKFKSKLLEALYHKSVNS